MKIHYLTTIALLSCLYSSAQTNVKKGSAVAPKQVKVYTTAQNTNYRLSQTATLNYRRNNQPVETETSIIVDPDKKFQTLLGIGGALTDASAETFAKMSKAQQQEFIDAYYNPQKGIGYTLA